MTPHPLNEAYFFESAPKLFHAPDGRYLLGLAELFGAHRCWKLGNDVDHNFVDDKCKVCGTQRKPHRHLLD